MLDTFGLREEDVILFENFYKEISSRFTAEIVEDLNVPFEKFELFRYYYHVGHQQSIRINDNFGKSYVAVLQVEYSYTSSKGGSGRQLEFQVWAFTVLPKEFGHVFIRREILTDKLVDFITRLEIDFSDDKEFSNQFYVLSDDRQRAELLLNKKFRALLKETSLKEFQLEIVGRLLAIGEKKTLESSDVKSVTELVYEIANIHF